MARREQLVMDTFVELADTLASDYDIADFLHMLVERCQDILEVTAGGVLVEGPEGRLRLATATSERMQRLEQAELDYEEGPCLDAYRGVTQVLAEDLREHADRWPNMLPHALDQGLLAAFAFPLRLRGDCIGALNLYRDEPGGFEEEDVRLGQAFGDVAAIGILQQRKVADAERRAEQLQHALDSRVVIEQAKGVVSERHGVPLPEAFGLLRGESRNSNRKLRDVCAAVAAGEPLSGSPERSDERS
ncbi:MAG: GAF and ANTAR domain-containing protein [Actinobacteria bacterium]|nr:GAF and ANTAR domain-containing protein [Actinomycetota bacterium]